MARAAAPEPAIVQDDPTQPRAVDRDGREVDEHGLPLNGPARRRALGDKPDPRDPAEPAAVPTTAQD